MSIQSQFAFSHSGDKVFNNMPDSVPHFFIRNMIPVGYAMKSSVACIFLSNSSVRVHVSHAYRKIEIIKERIIQILKLGAMFLSFHMVLSFNNCLGNPRQNSLF